MKLGICIKNVLAANISSISGTMDQGKFQGTVRINYFDDEYTAVGFAKNNKLSGILRTFKRGQLENAALSSGNTWDIFLDNIPVVICVSKVSLLIIQGTLD